MDNEEESIWPIRIPGTRKASNPQESFLRDRWSRPRAPISFEEEEKLTKDHFKDETDINNIVARWLKTGIPPEALARGEARYMDFTSVDDYLHMQEKLADVRSEFQLLPHEMRAEFDNDVSNLIEFLSDPGNHAEAREMGLMAPADQAEPDPAPPPPDPAPSPPDPEPSEPSSE